MAGSTVGALRVTLGMDSAAFEKGTKNAHSSLARLGKGFARLGTVAAAGIAAAGAALSVAMKSVAADADVIAKASQKLGIASDELQKLRYAADLSGVSFSNLETGVSRLTQSMSDVAKGGTTDAVKAFQALGINVKTAEGGLKSADVVISELAGKFAQYRDGAEKTALAIAIFGRSGTAMIPMLNQGAEALAKAKEEAAELGAVMSTRLQKASEAANDNWSRLGTVFRAVGVQISERMIPGIATLTDKIVEWAKQTRIAHRIGEVFAEVFRYIIIGAVGAWAAISALTEGVAFLWRTAKAGLQGNFEAIGIEADKTSASIKKTVAAAKEMIATLNAAPLTVSAGSGSTKRAAPTLPGKTAKGGGKKAKAKAGGEKKDPFAAIVRNADLYIAKQNALSSAIGLTSVKALELKFNQDLLNKATSAGIALTDPQKEKLGGLAKQMALASQAAKDAKADFDFAKGATLGFMQTLRQGLQAGEGFWKSFGNAALGVLDKIINKLETQLVDALFSLKSAGSGGGAGLGGLFSSALGGLGKLFGFANGGQFKVGGSGGIDSQLVAFKASPNETVSVTKPGQTAGGFAGRQEVVVRGVFVDDNGVIKAQMQSSIQQAAPAIVGASVNQVNKSMPGMIGNFDRRAA